MSNPEAAAAAIVDADLDENLCFPGMGAGASMAERARRIRLVHGESLGRALELLKQERERVNDGRRD